MKQLTRLSALLLACLVLLGSTLVACAAEQPSGFSDVSPDAWYADAVSWCRENGIMGGTSETAFSPNSPMTRAMLATVLHRAAGEPEAGRTTPFSDVSPDTWYTEAVAWAADQGLVTGYGNGRFGTDDPITREQLATILWRYAGSPATADGPDFKDAADLSGYALPAVSWAAVQGIVTGLDGNRFAPRDNATRAQVAAILTRYLSQDTQPAPVPEPQKPEAAGYPAFDLTAGTVPLNDGHTMPILGIGTYALSDQQAENSVYWALKAGFTSIMYDGSAFPLAENIERSRHVAKIAHALNASLEGELGYMNPEDGTPSNMGGVESYTRADDAKRYAEESGADALAIAIGNAHGIYKGKPHLDLGRLSEIHQAVSLPLVLHGSSGIPEELLQAAIRGGIRKININTEVSTTGIRAAKEFLSSHQDPNTRFEAMTKEAEGQMTVVVENYIACFRQEN